MELGHVFDDCRRLLAAQRDVSLNYVSRLANRAAHAMAHFPCELNSYVSFVSPPRIVLESMMYDVILE